MSPLMYGSSVSKLSENRTIISHPGLNFLKATSSCGLRYLSSSLFPVIIFEK